MSSAFNIALTALKAFDIKLDVNANNIANVNTDGFKKTRVDLQEAYPAGVQVTLTQVNLPGITLGVNEQSGRDIESSNVNLAEEIAEQIVTRYAFEANVLTIRTAGEMEQTLLDIFT